MKKKILIHALLTITMLYSVEKKSVLNPVYTTQGYLLAIISTLARDSQVFMPTDMKKIIVGYCISKRFEGLKTQKEKIKNKIYRQRFISSEATVLIDNIDAYQIDEISWVGCSHPHTKIHIHHASNLVIKIYGCELKSLLINGESIQSLQVENSTIGTLCIGYGTINPDHEDDQECREKSIGRKNIEMYKERKKMFFGDTLLLKNVHLNQLSINVKQKEKAWPKVSFISFVRKNTVIVRTISLEGEANYLLISDVQSQLTKKPSIKIFAGDLDTPLQHSSSLCCFFFKSYVDNLVCSEITCCIGLCCFPLCLPLYCSCITSENEAYKQLCIHSCQRSCTCLYQR